MTRTAIREILTSKSVDITKARVEALDFLLRNRKKLVSLPEILKVLGKNFDRVTVYRTLITLCDIGLVYKIFDTSNKTFYAVDRGFKTHSDQIKLSFKEHYHFQCISCNSVIWLPYSFQDIELPNGFIKTGVNLLLTGYCSKCSRSTNNISGKRNRK